MATRKISAVKPLVAKPSAQVRPRHRTKIPQLGVGLGLRRVHFGALLQALPSEIEWFEVAPENYMEIGGKMYRDFCRLREQRPILAHSVSLSLGSLDPLNKTFIKQLKQFIREHEIPFASDHICFSSYHQVQFDDLLPLPFTEEAVKHLSKRIRQVEEMLEVPFAVENASYYAPSGAPEMSEVEFIRGVVEEADCRLLLDVNNIYVNSVNHGFDAHEFLAQMPFDRIAYIHIAGHRRKRSNFILDTHGAEIITPVWQLLDELAAMTPLPSVLLERDNDIPPLPEIIDELKHIHSIVNQHTSEGLRHVAG